MFTIKTQTINEATVETNTETFLEKITRIVTPAAALKATAVGYWGVFWSFNGLDKYLNRSDFGLFSWYGKDRTEQFTQYFERLGIPLDAIDPVLYLTGIWELLVAAPFFYVIANVLLNTERRNTQALLTIGYVLTTLTFIGFSAFDVVAGDRAELREHGLYLALAFACFFVSAKDKTS